MISFTIQSLPKEIKLFHVFAEVVSYVSKPMQCYKCFHFGHISNLCKNNKICILCGETDHPGERYQLQRKT